MTSISSIDDFLNALDHNPTWREAVRARLMSEELMQLPLRFDRFENEFRGFRSESRGTLTQHGAQFDSMNATLARRGEQLTELSTTGARHGGFFNNLRGVDYEGQARVGAGRRLLRMFNARSYWQVSTKPRNGINELYRLLSGVPVLDLGQEQNALDDWAYEDALQVDLVFWLEFADNRILATGQASVTVDTQDVDRARRRAATIGKLTGTTTIPFVIGAAISPEAAAEVEQPGEAAVRWLQMDVTPEDD